VSGSESPVAERYDHRGGAHVLIVGVSTRAMAESAARAGYRVTSIDAFGDLDQHAGVHALSLPRDMGVAFSADAVVDAAAAIDCDAVAYLSPFENHPSALERLARGRTLLGNPPEAVRPARDPRLLASALGNRTGRWLLKPIASGGGHGIRHWTPGDPIPAGWHVQPFIDGTPGSIIFVAARGRAVPLAVTRQLVGDAAFGADGFRYCGSIVTALLPVATSTTSELFHSASELAAHFTRQLNLVGVNCVDFVARDDVAHAIEINPRWSASVELVERATGTSMFGVHARACLESELPSLDARHERDDSAWTLGKAILFARHDVTCGDTRDWLGDTSIRDVPHPSEHIPAGRPVCTIFASGHDVTSCYAALVARAERVHEQLESWASVPA